MGVKCAEVGCRMVVACRSGDTCTCEASRRAGSKCGETRVIGGQRRNVKQGQLPAKMKPAHDMPSGLGAPCVYKTRICAVFFGFDCNCAPYDPPRQ
jgi:hypothetical protein